VSQWAVAQSLTLLKKFECGYDIANSDADQLASMAVGELSSDRLIFIASRSSLLLTAAGHHLGQAHA